MTGAYHWWQRGIIYQIYPRSFQDSNGDGIGDLPGITARLDYLQWLGVDAIWISPVYPSPMADFGYDVADYTNIDPMFGTLADFDALVEAAHRRDLRVVMDFIPNHTSSAHPWFVESRSSHRAGKRDWYIWHDPGPHAGPPNNWLSSFGGSAWTFDATTEQYYYHAYLPQQPDLNWRNPEVRAAMLDVLRFWLERGVDGFRIDALRQLIKDEQFRDNPPNPYYEPGQDPYYRLVPMYSSDRPEIYEVISEWRRLSDQYEDRLLIGELYLPIEKLVTYYGVNGSGVQLPFNFHLILQPWQAPAITDLIEAYERALPADGWPNWVLGNHDKHRLASRIGLRQARVGAMLLLTLRGTPTLYYGDEIGMEDVAIPPEQVQDPWEKRVPGLGLGRDPERTPMQWDARPHAGFTTGTPWLPVATNYAGRNVDVERDDPRLFLTLYRRLIALRRNTPALAVGSYSSVRASGDLLAYVREHTGQRVLVALNLGPDEATLQTPMIADGHLLMSTYLDREEAVRGESLPLRNDEGVIVRIR